MDPIIPYNTSIPKSVLLFSPTGAALTAVVKHWSTFKTLILTWKIDWIIVQNLTTHIIGSLHRRPFFRCAAFSTAAVRCIWLWWPIWDIKNFDLNLKNVIINAEKELLYFGLRVTNIAFSNFHSYWNCFNYFKYRISLK